MYVLHPKDHLAQRAENDQMPLFFFAGPDWGGGDWQYRLFRIMKELFPKSERFLAALPRRYAPDHPLKQSCCQPMLADLEFPNQLSWERHYMERAALKQHRGCLIFWHAEESKEYPRTDGQPYARDTRPEGGEWRGRLIYDRNLRVVYGGQPGFSGIDVIRRNNQAALGDD